MTRTLYIFALFILCTFIEVSVFRSAYGVLSTTPFLFAMGILVAHRSHALHGSAWFLGSAIILQAFQTQLVTSIAFLVAAVAVYALETRLFATRSLYASVSLGVTTFSLYTLTKILLHLPIESALALKELQEYPIKTLLLLAVLIFGTSASKAVQSTMGKRFYIK